MALTAREKELLRLYKIELTDPNLVWGLEVPGGISPEIEVHLWGAGGGGGGNDAASQGGAGSGGQYCKITLNVSKGDVLTMVVGGAGLSGQSSRPLALGGNAGTGLIYQSKSYSGGIGGNAGSAGSSGAGGGGGGASVLMLNGEVIAIAGGGGGGGGAGISSAGQTAVNAPGGSTSFTNGEQGQDKRGDGGGGGGSAGGYNAGGSGSDTQAGDTGAPPGKSADVLIPAGAGNEKTYGNGVLPGAYLDTDYAFYTDKIFTDGVGIGGATATDGKNGGIVIVFQPTVAYYKDGAQWKDVSTIYYKVDGVWEALEGSLIKIHDQWRTLYNGSFVTAKSAVGQVGIDYRHRNMVPAPQPVYYWDQPGVFQPGDGGSSWYGGVSISTTASATTCSAADSPKIICTAMNQAYGFGSFRNAIWIAYADKHLTKAHEVGYHTIFLPLVDFGFKRSNGKLNIAVRRVMEWGTRHRSIDLRAEMRGTKRDTVGRIIRMIFEPLCYIVGKLKGY
jgi:hypothetical protein